MDIEEEEDGAGTEAVSCSNDYFVVNFFEAVLDLQICEFGDILSLKHSS